MLSIFLEYSIDSAHWLPHVPKGHKCGRMHGHRYDIRIEISGKPNQKTGWIIDYADAKKRIDPFIDRLDHQTLNNIPGLENPTCENIAMWFKMQLAEWFPGLSRIEVRETHRAGCVWRA